MNESLNIFFIIAKNVYLSTSNNIKGEIEFSDYNEAERKQT